MRSIATDGVQRGLSVCENHIREAWKTAEPIKTPFGGCIGLAQGTM